MAKTIVPTDVVIWHMTSAAPPEKDSCDDRRRRQAPGRLGLRQVLAIATSRQVPQAEGRTKGALAKQNEDPFEYQLHFSINSLL